MQRTVCLLVALCLATVAFAQGEAGGEARSSEAVDILEKVDAAAKAVKAVRYTAKSTPTGIAVNFVSAAEGTAVMAGWMGGMPAEFHVDIKTARIGSEEPVELTAGGNGDSYFLIDHQARKAYVDMDPGVLGSSGQTIQAFGMAEFVHDRPFEDELKAQTIELKGTETIGGEECYEIYIDYGGGQQSTWFFAKKDYLPRRRVQMFSFPGQGDGTFEKTITRLEINPDLDAALFAFKLPEGYEQIDDFAP